MPFSPSIRLGAGLILLLLLNTNKATAQYKFKPGQYGVELNFNPTQAQIFNISEIKVRKFIDTRTAYRLGVSAEIVQSSSPDEVNGIKLNDTQTRLGLQLRPGIEYHFEGTDRLSPYVGFTALLGFQNYRTVDESLSGTTVVRTVRKNANPVGYVNVGVGAVTGCDFYFAKNLFLGAELGLSLVYQKYATSRVETPTSMIEERNGSIIALDQIVNGQFRIGYVF